MKETSSYWYFYFSNDEQSLLIAIQILDAIQASISILAHQQTTIVHHQKSNWSTKGGWTLWVDEKSLDEFFVVAERAIVVTEWNEG